MLLPLNWLKDYVDIKLSPEKIAELLTIAGIEVVAFHEMGGDKVLEIEITPNRPDWLSIVGLAREIAAVTKSKLNFDFKIALKPDLQERNAFSISVQNKKDCQIYSARLIRDCSVGTSPSQIAKYVESVNLRQVNNIVDITNFVLFETGQPLHAFDFDKIIGGKIFVRRARDGETITTIDGATHKLDPRILVIADAKRPVAIAGIMGGKDTEVGEKTKNILLESACFDPVLTRRACRMLGISSDSSYRFERKVDLDKVIFSSHHAAELIREIAKGKISEFRSIEEKRKLTAPVYLPVKDVNNILGLNLSLSAIKDILWRLGFKPKPSGKDALKVISPSFREDVSVKEDLVEEVARIYGYDKIPTRLPQVRPYTLKESRVTARWLTQQLRVLLTAQGLNEVITYSLGSGKLFKDFGEGNSFIKTTNPLSVEQEFMRPLLLPCLLSVVSRNKNHQEPSVNIFEIGNTYRLDKGSNEILHLAVVLSGSLSFDWKFKEKAADLFVLKGILENIFAQFGIKKYRFIEMNSGLIIEVGEDEVGFLGEVSRKTLNNNFDIKDSVFALELDLEKLLKLVNLEVKFTALAKYPSSRRDISLVVKEDIKHSEIIRLIENEAGANLKTIELIDMYKGKSIPQGQKGLTYSLIYQSPTRTLTENEINSTQEKVVSALKNQFKAELRSLA